MYYNCYFLYQHSPELTTMTHPCLGSSTMALGLYMLPATSVVRMDKF